MKKIFFLAAFLGMAGAMSAQEYKMVVKTNDGNKEFKVADVKEVVFREVAGVYNSAFSESTDLVDIVADAKAANPNNTSLEIELKGVEYTMSAPVVSDGSIVFKGTSQDETVIKMTGADATFQLGGSFELSNATVDASASSAALITMSATPTIEATKNYYVVEDPIKLENVKVTGLTKGIYNDNGVKWAPKELLINNCVLQLATASSGVCAIGQNGFIFDLEITNSTIYETGSAALNYFIRYAGRPKDIDATLTQTVVISNSTLYNLANGASQWCNYRMTGQKTNFFTMTESILCNVGKNGQITRRFVGSSNNSNNTFKDNCYWFDGAASNESGYDKTNTAVSVDPQFVDAENGDFTVNSEDLQMNRVGDPRWLPEQDL